MLIFLVSIVGFFLSISGVSRRFGMPVLRFYKGLLSRFAKIMFHVILTNTPFDFNRELR